MALSRINHTGAAVVTGLAGPITGTSTSCTLVSATGWPTANFVMKLDAGTAAEEKVLCSSRSGTTVTFAVGGRGYDGTTATSHSAGTANAEHDLAAVVVDDVNDHVYTTTRDDHSQYARTDGTRAFTGNVTVNGNLTVTGSVSGVGAYTRVYQGASQNFSANTATQIVGLVQDVTGGTGAPTASSTGLTINTAGVYLISAAVQPQYPNGQTGCAPYMWIAKNGTAVRYVYLPPFTSNGSPQSLHVTDMVVCAASDVITYWIESPVGGVAADYGTTNAWLSAVQL